MNTATIENEMLDTPAAARLIGIEPATLRLWRSTGRVVIPYHRMNRTIRYRRTDLESYLDSTRVEPAAIA